MKVDIRLIHQLVAHICRLQCENEEGKEIQAVLHPYRNNFCKYRDDVEEID